MGTKMPETAFYVKFYCLKRGNKIRSFTITAFELIEVARLSEDRFLIIGGFTDSAMRLVNR